MNFTNFTETHFESLDGIDDSNCIKILHGILFIFGFTFGSLMNFGIIYYEKYGENAMKRTLQNKLFFALTTSILIYGLYINFKKINKMLLYIDIQCNAKTFARSIGP